MTKRPLTAAELMAELNADREYVAARQRDEEERKSRAAEWRLAEAPLVAELRAAGYTTVESVWDLVNMSAPYPAAVPILLSHLSRPYPAAIREGIARALAVPEGRVGWSLLMRLYRGEREERVKDGLAAALASTADDTRIEELIALAREKQNGPSRLFLLSALERSADERVTSVLVELKDDPELRKEIRAILRRKPLPTTQ